eukprot:scaffold41114_cov52-Prasinocladus_malaysianus.AAC.2
MACLACRVLSTPGAEIARFLSERSLGRVHWTRRIPNTNRLSSLPRSECKFPDSKEKNTSVTCLAL